MIEALDGVFRRWEIGPKKWEIWEIVQKMKWEMGDLNPKWEQEQGNYENMREHLFGSREIDRK